MRFFKRKPALEPYPPPSSPRAPTYSVVPDTTNRVTIMERRFDSSIPDTTIVLTGQPNPEYARLAVKGVGTVRLKDLRWAIQLLEGMR